MPEKKTTPPPKVLVTPGEHIDSNASLKTIAEVKSYLLGTGNFDNYEKLSLNYDNLNPQTLEKQIAMSVIFVQPRGVAVFGELDLDAELVMSTQQEGRYDAGKRALPMGKIELVKDIVFPGDEKDSKSIIINAANRERLEEITNTPAQMDTILAGSFVDKKTGFTLHVVIEDVVATSQNEPFSVSLSEAQKREDAKIQLVKIKDLNQVEPISNGVKLCLLIALEAIENQAKFLNGTVPTNK